ncbi:GPP34 family phosphoprotein [Nocardia sp. NPDC058058]|uniref:GOLPH3/VPS74 family protein n=1 Tax=Nocardia sp. NPDC058058 TaxID=3346317 RepID=UPI0036DE1D12
MTPLIAEDLLWLLHDDRTGEPMLARPVMDRLLAGAVLLELTSVAPDRPVPAVRIVENRRVPRAVANLDTPLADTDAILLAARAAIAGRPRTPAQVLEGLGRGLRENLLARLTARGRVRCERTRVLGVFGVDTWPTVDVAGKRQLRMRLQRVLLDHHPADARIAALLALLSSVRATGAQCAGWAPDVVEKHARAQRCEGVCTAVVQVIERAVHTTQAGLFTGAA